MLESIARALVLEPDAERYLEDLARPKSAVRRRPSRPERVSASLQTLIDGWELTPAMIQSRRMATLAANAVAVALCPYFAPGVHTLRAAFLEPEMRELYRDWDDMTAKAVAFLRSVPDSVDDPAMHETIGELSMRSERFRTLWARRDVRQKASGPVRFAHPQVGELDFSTRRCCCPARPARSW